MVAVINNFGGFFQTWVYFNEAKRFGANINLPCVNNSNYKTRIIGKEIYIGFIHINNLEVNTGQIIPGERELNGCYKNLEDFLERNNIGLEQIIILIRANSLRFIGKSKSQLLWQAHMIIGKSKPETRNNQLFKISSKKFTLPHLQQSKLEDTYDEIELLGFPVSLSYFDLLKTSFRGVLAATDLINNVGKTIRMVGQLVTIKYVRTVKKEIMHFATFIDVHGEFFDTVHFPDSLRYYPFRGTGVYLILGLITEEFDYPSITVKKMAKLPIVKDPRYS